MIRLATLFDVNSIVDLGLEALNSSAKDDLLIDKEKVRREAVSCVSSAANFAWVSDDKGIQGALLAETSPLLFHKGFQVCAVQFHCKKPGDGRRLVKELIKWSEERPAIKAVSFTLEHECDPRIILLLKRMGFDQEFPAMMRVKNVQNSERREEGPKENIQRREKSL